MAYDQFNSLPAYTKAIWENGKVINKGDTLLWSAKFAPPAIGSKIVVTMNGCGPAIVTGYFSEDGWLGVKCKLTDAPEWHRKQNKNDPNGHAFGAEFRLLEEGEK